MSFDRHYSLVGGSWDTEVVFYPDGKAPKVLRKVADPGWNSTDQRVYSEYYALMYVDGIPTYIATGSNITLAEDPVIDCE
jgi:hypothetical protein